MQWDWRLEDGVDGQRDAGLLLRSWHAAPHRPLHGTIFEDFLFQRIVQRTVCDFEQLSVRSIPAEFPNHDAAQVLMRSIAGLEANGDGIFIGPECAAVEEPGGLRAIFPID